AQMYEAENALNQADLQQQTAEAQLAVLNLNPRAEAVAEAQSRIDTAEAGIKTATTQLKFITIEAPIEGTFDSSACGLGQTWTVGTPIGEIIDTRKLHLLIWLPARDAARVRVGQKARIKSAKTENTDLPGTVAFVGREADAQTGNLPVRILVDN